MDWKSPRIWLQIVLSCIVKITFAQEFFFQESSYTASEADRLITIRIERTGPLDNFATVDITSSGDIALGITQIEFPVGVSSFDAGIAIVDDPIATPDRSAILTLSNPSEGSIGSPSSTTITITDNDGGGGPAPVWNDWGSWSQCSQTCGGGTRRRTRTCDNLNFGNVASCQGPSTEEDQCNTQRCPDYCSSETEKTPYGSISTPDSQPVGTTYISDEVCPWYTRYENNPIARVHCVQGNNMAHWNWDIDCGGNKTAQEIFEILSNQPITEDNVESTLQMTEDLTGHANDIQAEGVSLVTDILRNVVNLKTPKREVTDVVVTILSNLMDVEASVITQAQMMDGSPSDAVEIFEEQLQVVQIHREDIGAWPYRRVTRNVAAEVFEASDDVFNNGIYAASDSRSTNTLLTLERQASTNLDVEIEIPSETFENQQQLTRVAIDVLASNRLLTSTRLQDQNSRQTDFKTVTNSRVISATVGDQKISDLDKPIRMTYRPLELHANNTQCVFWDFPRNDWSTDGCRYLGETPEWMVICECNHLTNFAILMDIYGGSTLTKTQDFILEILTYVGCVLSILGLAVTLLTYCTSRKLKSKRPNQILINLSSALLGLYVVFVILLSIDTGRDQAELEAVACSILAGVLHYFTLASLFWMAVEGFNMYLMFIKVINSYIPSLLLKASLFAWGVPFLIVAVTAGIARDGYARGDFCFLEKWPLVGGVLVPIGLILIFNMIIFVIVMMKLSRESPASKLQQKRKGLKMRRLRNAICIMTLMGLTWVIGYLSIIKAASFFSQLIFCLLNAMQGYAIFMLYCVQQADVRNSWREVCGTIRRRPQSSLSSSRARGTSGGEFISSNRRSGSSSADDAALLNGNNTSF